MATRVLLEHVRHVCPPELEIELLVLAPEEIVALADVEGEEGGVVLEPGGFEPGASRFLGASLGARRPRDSASHGPKGGVRSAT